MFSDVLLLIEFDNEMRVAMACSNGSYRGWQNLLRKSRMFSPSYTGVGGKGIWWLLEEVTVIFFYVYIFLVLRLLSLRG